MLMVLAFLLISNTNALMRFLYVDTVSYCTVLTNVSRKKKKGKKRGRALHALTLCTHAEESFTNCQVSMVRHSLWEAPVKEEEHWFVCRTKVYRSL